MNRFWSSCLPNWLAKPILNEEDLPTLVALYLSGPGVTRAACGAEEPEALSKANFNFTPAGLQHAAQLLTDEGWAMDFDLDIDTYPIYKCKACSDKGSDK
ncbi:MAG: hypothetical protein ACFCU3_08170 [Verrucomicrobiales bacterium]